MLANASLQKSEMCVQRALLDAKDDHKEVYSSTTTHRHGGRKDNNRSSTGGLPSCPLSAAAFKIRRVPSGAVTEDDGAKLLESL